MPAKTKINRDELAQLTAQGWTVEQLAEHFKVHPTSISRLRTRLGISTKPAMTPERRATIQAMFDDGWPAKEIHRTEGADMETLRKHFPGQAWTPRQAQEHTSAVRPIFRKIRRAERFKAMARSYGNAA